jgi:hypothetical protein
MEAHPAMERERVAIVHNHLATINFQLTMMEEMMTVVMVHHQVMVEKRVAARMDLDLDLMGMVEMMKGTWRQDLGRLALLLILRVGVRAESKAEGVHSLIGCLKF